MNKISQLLLNALTYRQAENLRDMAYAAMRWSGLGHVLSRFSARGPAIFVYHSIGGRQLFYDNVLPVEAFERQLEFLSRNYTILPLSEIIEGSRRDPARLSGCVALTFDDGYRDFVDNALPILRAYNAPSAYFIPTDILEGKPLFFDSLHSAVSACCSNQLTVSFNNLELRLPTATAQERDDTTLRLAMMLRILEPDERVAFMNEILAQAGAAAIDAGSLYVSADELAALGGDVEIGSHSCGHYNLARLPDEHLYFELAESKRILEKVSGRKVQLLAYPFGKSWSFDHRVKSLVADIGYSAAMTTLPGLATDKADPYAIPRYGATASLSRYILNSRGVHL